MENKTKFYVIEFEKLPTEDYDKYVCVPRSWVLGQANDKLAFKYPLEKMSITNKRIAEGDCASEEWPLYLETLKYETDSLSNAKQFRCLMEKSFNKTRRRSSQVNAKAAKTPTKPKVTNKEIHDNLNSGNETEESDDERMEEDQFDKHADQRRSETHGNGEHAVRRGSTGGNRDNHAPIRRSSTGGSRDNQAPNVRRGSTEGRRDSQAPNVRRGSTEGRRDSQAPNVRRGSTEGRRDSQAPNIRRNSTESRRDNQVQNNPSISDTTLNDSHAIHIISTTLQHLVKEMKRQNDNIEKFYQDFIVNRDVTLQNATLLKEIAKKLMINTDCLKRPLSDSDDKVKENNTPAPIQGETITKRRKSVRIQEDQERTESGKSEENTPKKQYIRPFSLPREYDPKDSRWTLRYREMGPGLEELKKNSGVYIDSIRFENCKRLARDEKTLARLLLVEIFTDQALGTCSLTGARAKAFDPDGTNTRPGLDERARNVLLNFVEEHCHEKRWQSSEKQSIMNTLRNKMQEIRSRYVK